MADSPPGLPLDQLLPWFRENVAQVGELTAQVVGHGRSNITYRVAEGDKSWVVRRPPLSHVQATAHDMGREFRILTALAPTGFPAPKPYALCDDTEIIGAQFYVMEFVDGFIAVDPSEVEKRFDEADRKRIGEELIDVLVQLHSYVPDEIGLSDFGKPQGYVERQVRRFAEQLEDIRYRETPELDELAKRLANAHPARSASPASFTATTASTTRSSTTKATSSPSSTGRCARSATRSPTLGLLRMYWGQARPASHSRLAAAGDARCRIPDVGGGGRPLRGEERRQTSQTSTSTPSSPTSSSA